jgi:dCMP deaminase
MKRPSFEEMALKIALECSKRSEDIHKKVGCVVLNKENRVLSTGYNGLISNFNVSKNFLKNRDSRRPYMIHAEINALSQIKTNDNPYILVSTLLPCSSCALNIAAYKIKKIFYIEEYNLDQNAKKIFDFYNIKYKRITL